MRKWLLIGAAGAVVGYVSVYFALDRAPAPEPEPERPTATAEPVMLADVVEVTDLEPLLEKRSEEPPGVPFDPTEPLEAESPRIPAQTPSTPTSAPVPIPPAAEEPAVQQGAAPPVDPSRVVWYGDHRLPRQVGGGLSPDQLWRELRECIERTGPRCHSSMVGVGLYF